MDYNIFNGNPDILPDGSTFSFWDDTTTYKKAYHVNTNAVNASDENDGSEKSPFKTINRAAKEVNPGERVIIHAGIYRETVSDIHGGTGSKQMVKFESAGDGDVIITGAEEWRAHFSPSEGYRQTPSTGEPELFSLDDSVYYSENKNARVWMGKIPRNYFIGYNPFAVMNSPNVGFVPCEESRPFLANAPYGQDRLEFTPLLKKRGLMFCDGEIMEQVVRPYDLWEEAECKRSLYWVAEGGLEIHFRLKNDDSPENHKLELAVREQGFAPDEAGQAFIHINGIKFEKFSNPFIPPQKGAVSTSCGHHWIIENCVIEKVNTVGIDIGFQSHFAAHEGLRGFHIIRKNIISNCGINAVCGLPTRGRPLEGVLIEQNRISGCCWHNAELLWESASVKNHFTKNCLYRFNVILDTHYGNGIWLDKSNANSRICYNTMIGCRSTMYGMIFVEASFAPNLIDHNFVSDVGKIYYPRIGIREGGHGIYQHEVDNLIVLNNIIHNTEGYGVFMLYTKDTRVLQGNRGLFNRGNKVLQNIIHDCQAAISLPTEKNYSDNNILGKMNSGLYDFYIECSKEKHSMDTFREIYGFEENSCYADEISITVDKDAKNVSLSVVTATKKAIFSTDLTDTDNVLKFFNCVDNLYR